MEAKPYLSVVIPAYNEGERIGSTLLKVGEYLGRQGFDYEIIVVVDGSPDNTAKVSRDCMSQVKNLRVIENQENRGKGYVVRQGLLDAGGKYRLFMDADGSTSIDHLDKFLPEIEKEDLDIVIGSRDLQGSVIQIHQPKYRELFGDMGNWLIRLTLQLWKYPDTQCGFKILSERATKGLVRQMVVDRFGFDFELLALASEMGFGIMQMPVRWMNEEGSTVGMFGPNGFIQVLKDLFKTKGRLLAGKYFLNNEL